MMNIALAELYLNLMGKDPEARRALLACAASLRLDDETALEAIQLVAGSNGHSEKLMRRVKQLGCVWADWNGAWYLSDEVRAELERRLDAEVGAEKVAELRTLLAARARQKAESLVPDGQITAYETRLLRLEAGFQRTLLSNETACGAADLADLWTSEYASGQRAIADAVDFLAPEIERQLPQLPAEVLFLQGMAARQRGDRVAAERYFRAVWKQGRPGEIFAIAAHLFGNGVARRDPQLAESAFQDSLRWNDNPQGQGQVWHSLGNLLARDRRRRSEAEAAYQQSLDLISDPQGQGQVWHSLGNLLARDRQRRSEAEAAYQQSLDLISDPQGQGQVWHSLGNLLARDRQRWSEAEAAYQQSLDLISDPQGQGQVYASWADGLSKQSSDGNEETIVELAQQALELDPRNPRTAGVAYRVMANAYEKVGEFRKAIDALELLIENNRRLDIQRFTQELRDRIEGLRTRMENDT